MHQSRGHPIWSALLIFVYIIMNFSVQELRGVIESFNLSVGRSLLILLGIGGHLGGRRGLYAPPAEHRFRIPRRRTVAFGVIFKRRFMRR